MFEEKINRITQNWIRTYLKHKNAIVDPYSMCLGACHYQFQPICKPSGGLFQQYMVPAKEKIVLFCLLYAGPFLVLNPRCSELGYAHADCDISKGIADIAVLSKRLYHVLPRATLGRDHDAQALLLWKTSILVAT